MDEARHIASLVVLARPELFDAVKANLCLLDGLELHQQSSAGKLVVVLEAVDENQILQRIDQINNLPGVLNAALIYHELLDPAGETE
ncbi:chaperone NapD [Pseudomonas putida]|uniref:chaperone NapD n=1 Tax=Pseudomonas putida TaxID=303 RepID=UPI0023667B04|nr:chaperone NapD [Pseudomonas putida]MDD2046640.1 chaperone NapD [Pseudomonas putida]